MLIFGTFYFFMIALLNRAVHYILPCGFFLLFSSPNLSRRRLDVCHTFTHGVALVRPLPSNRHHRSNGDCLDGKRENYQVCSVQYCVQ